MLMPTFPKSMVISVLFAWNQKMHMSRGIQPIKESYPLTISWSIWGVISTSVSALPSRFLVGISPLSEHQKWHLRSKSSAPSAIHSVTFLASFWIAETAVFSTWWLIRIHLDFYTYTCNSTGYQGWFHSYMREQVEESMGRFLVNPSSDLHSCMAHLGAVVLELVVTAGVSAEGLTQN